MGKRQLEPRPVTDKPEEHPNWREVLLDALSGLYPTDQQLEQMLDHLERTP